MIRKLELLRKVHLDEIGSKQTYLVTHLLWLAGAILMLSCSFTDLQSGVSLDFAEPNAVKNSFIPLFRYSGLERTLFRIDGLKFQIGILLLLALKTHFILSRRPIANYLLSPIIFPLWIYYAWWSGTLVGCADCSSAQSPFFPVPYFWGSLMLVYWVFMLGIETICLSYCLLKREGIDPP